MQLKDHLQNVKHNVFEYQFLSDARFPDAVAVVVSHWSWLYKQVKFHPQYMKTLVAQACCVAGTSKAGLVIPASGFSLASFAVQEALIYTCQETMTCARQAQHCRSASFCMHRCLKAIIPVLSSSIKIRAVLLAGTSTQFGTSTQQDCYMTWLLPRHLLHGSGAVILLPICTDLTGSGQVQSHGQATCSIWMFNLNDTLWKSFGSFVLIACKGTCVTKH